MDRRQILGFSGAALLLVGFFTPLFSISFMGFSKSIGFVDFISQGSWASILVLVSVVAAAVLTALKRYMLLLVPAGLVVALLIYVVTNLTSSLVSTGVDSTMVSTLLKLLQPGFGWFFLVVGPVALVLGAFLKPKAA
jgi:hypothetical protein